METVIVKDLTLNKWQSKIIMIIMMVINVSFSFLLAGGRGPHKHLDE